MMDKLRRLPVFITKCTCGMPGGGAVFLSSYRSQKDMKTNDGGITKKKN